MTAKNEMTAILSKIQELPKDWHDAGSLSPNVLASFIKNAKWLPFNNSMETGTGKSTLLLSHMSNNHTVFTIPDQNSYHIVSESDLLNRSTVNFILGSTQQTIAAYEFDRPLDFALIDGPHAYPFPELEYYHIYPHLETGALLVIDDIHIPTIFNLFSFLCEEEMFELIEIIEQTAFFQRNSNEIFSPIQDGWTRQIYNKNRFPIDNYRIEEASHIQNIKLSHPNRAEIEMQLNTIMNSLPYRIWSKLRRFVPISIRRFLGSRS